MERVVSVTRDFAAAREWDIRQQVALSPQERLEIAAELKRRAWPAPQPDIREWHRNKEAAGRPKDLDDLDYLRRIGGPPDRR